MKVFLLAILVAAVAAAPRYAEHPYANLPEAVVLPEAVILPEPVLPEVKPDPVLLPEPVLPEVKPEPVILPEPVLPEPSPEIFPEEPIVVDDPAVSVEDSIEIEEPVIIDKPEVVPQIPSGEIYNDGLVQVTLNTPEEAGYLSSLQSWFSMILNYFSNGVQSSHQIV